MFYTRHGSGNGEKPERADTAHFIWIFFPSQSGIKWQILWLSAAFKHRIKGSHYPSIRTLDILKLKSMNDGRLFPLPRVIFEDLLEAKSIFSTFCWPCERCKSDLITVRIQSAFLKWLIVWGGRRGNIDVRLRRIIRRIRPHSSLLTTHSQHDTRRNRIKSVMSSFLCFSHQEQNSICKVSWKALLPFLMSNLQSFPKYWCRILKISLSSPIPFLQFVLLSQMQFVQRKEISTYGKFSDVVEAPFSFSLGAFSTLYCETQKSYLGRHLSEPKNHSFLSVCPWFWGNVLKGSSTMFY